MARSHRTGHKRSPGQEQVLSRVHPERREFLRQLLVGAAFASPVVTIFPLSCSSEELEPVDDLKQKLTGTDRVLVTISDTTLRSNAPDTNEGANPFLRVGGAPAHRALVAFSPSQIEQLRSSSILAARLVLTIANNHNDWGKTGGQVYAHPLLSQFAEGNGKELGLAAADVLEATIAGATWNGPWPSATWSGGDYGPARAAPVLHENQQLGSVSWDVTKDVLSGTTAWLLRVEDERAVNEQCDAANGTLEYFSRQSATSVVERRPLLILTVESAPVS